jgi:hypothetical protein
VVAASVELVPEFTETLLSVAVCWQLRPFQLKSRRM